MPEWMQDVENAVDGQAAQQNADPQGNNSSNDKMLDTGVDSAVDAFATKEGLPAAADPEINNLVNDEVNKF